MKLNVRRVDQLHLERMEGRVEMEDPREVSSSTSVIERDQTTYLQLIECVLAMMMILGGVGGEEGTV